jgi:hypothetical protein
MYLTLRFVDFCGRFSQQPRSVNERLTWVGSFGVHNWDMAGMFSPKVTIRWKFPLLFLASE